MTFLLVVGAAALVTALLAYVVLRRSRPALVSIAEELRSDLPPAQVESRIATMLGAARKVDVEQVMQGRTGSATSRRRDGLC